MSYRLSIEINAAFNPASSATTALTYRLYFSSKACFSTMILREISIPKSRDLVSHNPGISGMKNGPGFQYPGIRDPGIAIPRYSDLASSVLTKLYQDRCSYDFPACVPV